MEKTYDLDELFGDSKPVRVKANGKVYELRRLDSFTPDNLIAWERLQAEFRGASTLPRGGKAKHVRTDSMSVRIERIVTGIVNLLCPAMVEDGVPFAKQLAALRYYNQITAPKANSKKVTPRPLRKRTGRGSSRA